MVKHCRVVGAVACGLGFAVWWCLQLLSYMERFNEYDAWTMVLGISFGLPLMPVPIIVGYSAGWLVERLVKRGKDA